MTLNEVVEIFMKKKEFLMIRFPAQLNDYRSLKKSRLTACMHTRILNHPT